MKIDGIDKTTGEVMKPYNTPEHRDFLKVVNRQVAFIKANIRDGDQEKISGASGDVLVDYLMTLVGYYEELGRWLANEKLHLADLKLSVDLKFANEYIAWKQEEKETNETARMRAKIACGQDQTELDENRHAYDVLTKYEKYISKLHESIRSQLSYEKSLSQMTRG